MKNTQPKLLFVDDDKILLESFKVMFRKGYSVETCPSPYAALGLLNGGKRYDVIVSDMRMPGMNGVEFLRQAAKMDRRSARIMLTGHADLDTAIAAINDGGVSHFLTKPCSTENLKEIISACVVSREGSTEAENEDISSSPSLKRFVGVSPAVKKLHFMLQRLSQVDATVLFTGESGTGKSLAAEILHSLSERRDRPFVRVNCPSLSEGVFEAELFGSVRGAYTGAVKDSAGRFQAAEGGSLLLDEIGDLPWPMQPKLLQVIERKEYERVGDHKTMKSDVRIMAATNADLNTLVARGEFRKDLYYRLNVMHLELPPLRERRDDIPLLVEFFLTEMSAQTGVAQFTLSGGAMKAVQGYSWPGNVRELKHCLERGATLCSDGVIQTEDLPECLLSGEVLSPPPRATEDLTREDLLAVLKNAGWNKARAARSLGMSRSTLYRKIKEAGIPTDEAMN